MHLVSGTRTRPLAFAIAVGLALPLSMLQQSVQAQTFKVIYTFTGHSSAANPIAGVIVDDQGNLYGSTAWGGASQTGSGTVYELRRTDSGFAYRELHDFGNGSDGSFPWAGVTMGPDGTLYGTTYDGGTDGNGVIYNLRPALQARACSSLTCPWTETILYNFTRGSDGGDPQGGVIFDPDGNFYGTNVNGGSGNVGVVYEMTKSGSGWKYQVIYPFANGQDGGNPVSLVFDSSGNLFGAAAVGGLPGCQGFGCGTVFELSPSGQDWMEKTLYRFQDGADGANPQGGVIIDSAGNIYGSTCCGDSTGGTVFQLSPSGDTWSFSLLYSYNGSGLGPYGSLVRDAAGNLYGASVFNGLYNQGVVFKLTPTQHGWTYTSIHDFTGGADGGWAEGGLTIDSKGNIYGTTYQGGLQSCGYCGVVYQITP